MPKQIVTYKAWHLCAHCGQEYEVWNEVFNYSRWEQGKWQDISSTCGECGKTNIFAVPPKGTGKASAPAEDKAAIDWLTNRIIGGNGW